MRKLLVWLLSCILLSSVVIAQSNISIDSYTWTDILTGFNETLSWNKLLNTYILESWQVTTWLDANINSIIISGTLPTALINTISTYLYQEEWIDIVEWVFIKNKYGNVYNNYNLYIDYNTTIYNKPEAITYSWCVRDMSILLKPFPSYIESENWQQQADECIKIWKQDNKPKKQYYSYNKSRVISTWYYKENIYNGFARWYCTWYTAIISPDIFAKANIKWNANRRCESAQSEWLTVSHTPSVWAIIVYSRITSYAWHVWKVVEYDNSNWEMIIKEMNYVWRFIANTRIENTNNKNIKCYISL